MGQDNGTETVGESVRLCMLRDQKGKLVLAIPPQRNLDALHTVVAEWACGEFIPTVYAQQAVMKALLADGYSICWGHFVPELSNQ